jgi:hypothetical protein
MKAAAIHGDKTQVMRENVLYQFKRGHVDFLIATDVAARGLGTAARLLAASQAQPTLLTPPCQRRRQEHRVRGQLRLPR